MRTDSLLTIVTLSALCICGCAPKFKAAGKPPSAAPRLSLSKAARQSDAGHDALGNTKPSTWKRMTTFLTSAGTPKPAEPTGKSDPIRLSSPSGQPTPDMHVSMAKLLENAGQLDKAVQHYEKALALESRDLRTLMEYAHLLDRQGRFQEAAQKYELACRFHPQVATAFNDYGLCLARMNRLDEALGPMQQAIALSPENKLYSNNIAKVLVELGRSEEALHYLRQTFGEAIAHYNVGYLLQSRGQVQAAAGHFGQAASLDPSLVAARQWVDRLAAGPAPSTAFQMEGGAVPQPGPATRAATAPLGPRYQGPAAAAPQ